MALGRLTTRLFWFLTRSDRSRPCSTLTTDRTSSESARRTVSDARPFGANRAVQAGLATDPVTVRRERRFDFVALDVVAAIVVLAVGRATLPELLGRRIDGDLTPPRPIEEGHVFRHAGVADVGERAELASAHLRHEGPWLGQHRPLIAAQAGKIDSVRIRGILSKDRGRTCQLLRVYLRQRERVEAEMGLDFRGRHLQQHRVEPGAQRLVAGINPNLAAFGLGRWMERHFAVADEDDRGDASLRPRHEHRAVSQEQFHVLGAHHQVSCVQLGGRIQCQALEAVDAGDGLLGLDDPAGTRDPRVGDLTRRAPDVEPPRDDPAVRTPLDEDVDGQPEGGARRSAGKREPVALPDHGPRNGGIPECRERGRAGPAAIGLRGQQ